MISIVDVALQSLPMSDMKKKFGSWSLKICQRYVVEHVALAKSMANLMLKLNAVRFNTDFAFLFLQCPVMCLFVKDAVNMQAEQDLAAAIQNFSPHRFAQI